MDNDRTTDRIKRLSAGTRVKLDPAARISSWDKSAPHRTGVITQVQNHQTCAEISFHLDGESQTGFKIVFEIDMEVPRLLIYTPNDDTALISIHATEPDPIIRVLKVT